MSIARHRELVVLATLSAHPMHGYALAEVLEEGLGPAVGLQRPTVYAILKRFEARGWIVGSEEQQGDRPPRSVYALTADGRAALPELAGECAAGPVDSSLPVAALLAHLDLLPEHEGAELIDALLQARRQRLAALAPLVDHPGLLGVAFGLMHDQLVLEIRVLEQVASE